MNIRKAVKLDFLSIVPYLTVKNLILLIFFGSLYAFLFKNPIMVIGMSQIFSMMFATYPFMVGDEGGIDPLFKIVGLKADYVVQGRYLLSHLFVIIMLVAGIVFGTLGSAFYSAENSVSISVSSALITFILTSLAILMQYPAYFKLGYLKAKPFGMIPFFVIGIVVFLAVRFSSDTQNIIKYFIQHRYVALLALVALWCIAFFVSISLSKKFYKARDF